MYVDYDSGRTGALFAVGRDEFVAGPSVSTGYPVMIRLRVERDAADRGQRITYERKGQAVQAVRRQFYSEVPVRYASGEVSIAGSLLLPAAAGPHPAVVMIHGSGAVTRDTLRPFADHFARNGVAVLITDKRGTGASTGRWARATFDDLADDALAGVQYLRSRTDIQASAIGLHGMSLGGWVAPLAAVKSRDVAFVIVESAPVMTPREHERLRVETTMRAESWVPVYPGADWHEREAWEMFGIVFDGHPSLRHLYLPSEFEGHPLRKDYPLLAREVKPWPGLVDVEGMPGEPEEEAGSEGGGE